MSAISYSFIDIFGTGEKTVQIKKIAIPLIQRDYAQGRIDDHVNRVRRRFLTSLYNAVVGDPITLDFVYGDIDDKGTLTPLDGQQRLTTLFLLHWYAAKKEKISKEEYTFLGKFSYETRYSARYFCDELVKFDPDFNGPNFMLSEKIINQAWFPLGWKKDPTISAMLVMLDDIHKKFQNCSEIWNRLKDGAITFYFLPIKDMGLTDELYIKMNSRGKPLTLFEHFKAELEREIRALDEKTAEDIILSIDTIWTDLLWNYRNGGNGDEDDNIIDDEFLRYFRFICDIICYRKGDSPRNYDNDVFNLLNLYFSAQNKTEAEKIAVRENITVLKSFFDCWLKIDGFENPTEFLESFMSHEHETGKIIDSKLQSGGKNKIYIFEDCLRSYSDKSGKKRDFPLNRMVLLYAITQYLQHQSEVTKEDFVKRIRVINNLIRNSENEISDRLDGNRIPDILKAIDAIILTGVIDDTLESNFNSYQIKEEIDKAAFLREHPERAADLYKLEDHDMLKGQISIIGLENLSYGTRFASLFKCSLDKIDRALMAKGDYGQTSYSSWLYQYGSKDQQDAWDQLFHKKKYTDNEYKGFNNTKSVLISLLKSYETFTDEILDSIAKDYITKCEDENVYPWRYYYIKYGAFRVGRYGKLWNEDAKANPYLFSVMLTKSNRGDGSTYMPYLKAAAQDDLDHDKASWSSDWGQRLIYSDFYIVCENSSYKVYKVYKKEDDIIVNKNVEPVETIDISQNEGIDTEDRIVKLKNYIKQKISTNGA